MIIFKLLRIVEYDNSRKATYNYLSQYLNYHDFTQHKNDFKRKYQTKINKNKTKDIPQTGTHGQTCWC